MKDLAGLIFLIASTGLYAADPYPKNDAIDIIHYSFQLEVNDSSDSIRGEATVTVLFTKPTREFELDLAGVNGRGGMQVSRIESQGVKLQFAHQQDRLKIILPAVVPSRDERSFIISYRGIPRDGLKIGKNKFGDRGFYGDNWPDRGHHWLPVIDHPSDKASVDFVVIAPDHYGVVANGIKVEESYLDAHRKLTHWHEEVNIPVKVMVVGIARFAVQYVGKVDDISVESWVYPQNKEAGFHDYAVASNILDFFHHHIGPYPYKKLANVQSITQFGALENANTIFYAQDLVGKIEQEPIIAHEEAHQWFGDSASENDWYHVWLSEGFATYFANLYLEYEYGHDRLVAEEKIDREEVIRYFKQNQAPVVDTTKRELNSILNINTYQKGGWVLHMLRREVGDQTFWKGIQEYYRTYKNGNAMTTDFQRVMESISGKDLSVFFAQWLYRGGHPRVTARWTYDARRKEVSLTVAQTQGGAPFVAPLDIAITTGDGKTEIQTVLLAKSSQQFVLPSASKPSFLSLDPHTWLLFEGKIEVEQDK